MINRTSILLFFAVLILGSFSLSAEMNARLDSAKQAYDTANFNRAIQIYQEVLEEHPYSMDLHYNLANAYFKSNELASAILHYEKALKIDPNHEDASHNLSLANAKTVDKIEAIPELFLYRWWKAIFNLFSSETWAKLSLLFLYLGLAFGLVYLFLTQVSIKKIGFFTGISLLGLSLLSWFLGARQESYLIKSSHAIIMEPTININSSPSEGSSKLFVLHEGTKVNIEDQSDDWFEISIPNGNKGWVKKERVAAI